MKERDTMASFAAGSPLRKCGSLCSFAAMPFWRLLVLIAALVLCAAGSALGALPVPGRAYRGTNSEHHKVKLEVSRGGRTIVLLNAGSVTVKCGEAGGPDRQEPLNVADRLHIRKNGRFAKDGVFFTSGNAGAVSGRFVSRRRARGRVSISTRDDCFGSVAFSATR
jgi:hypothetical protein